MNGDQNEPKSTKVVLYQAADGKVTVNVTFAIETKSPGIHVVL